MNKDKNPKFKAQRSNEIQNSNFKKFSHLLFSIWILSFKLLIREYG